MILLLISREFRWTFNLSDEQLKKVLIPVNNKRKNDIYRNFKAAIVVLGTDKKVLLKSNPFCRSFEDGKHRKGYWDGNHASTQLEDCNDFFFTLFSSDVYQLVYELDHSQAYKWYAEDVHVMKHFNLNPGGPVLIVHDIIIKTDSLGSFSHDKNLNLVIHTIICSQNWIIYQKVMKA